jgi:hypothetical protein
MIDAPIQIRNPDVVRDIRKLAERTGQLLTEAVAEAVRARLAEVEGKDAVSIAERRMRIAGAAAAFRALPHDGTPLTDADIYDEDGLPR